MNSFHAWMNANTPVATTPGATSGRVIVKNARSRLAPVDHRRLLELARHVADEAAQRPDRERQDEDEVGQRQADDRVRQAASR